MSVVCDNDGGMFDKSCVGLSRARNVVVKVFFVLMIGLTIDCELRGDIGTAVLTPTFYNVSDIRTLNLGHTFDNQS